jgi:hypothetical protein
MVTEALMELVAIVVRNSTYLGKMMASHVHTLDDNTFFYYVQLA